MTQQNPLTSHAGLLATLPTGAKLMLTAFLAIIGFGYLIAVANIFSHHALADGKEGLSLDDLRTVYSGIDVPAKADGEIPSRMLTMLRGEMRQYTSSDAHFSVLEDWLRKGGKEAEIEMGEGKVTPKRAMLLDCMRCHAQSTGTQIAKEAPFGPDEFTIDYAMLASFITPAKSSESESTVRVAPQRTLHRLILISHQHMLAIPMFTLVVGLMFLVTRWPPGLRHVVAPIPMLVLVADFASWWLARIAEPFIYIIAAAGGLFGAAFGFQLLAVVIDMWRPAGQGARDGEE